MNTGRAKAIKLQDQPIEERYTTEIAKPLCMISGSARTTIRSNPHPPTGEMTPRDAQTIAMAAQYTRKEIVIENALGGVVFHMRRGEIQHPDDSIAFWRAVGAV